MRHHVRRFEFRNSGHFQELIFQSLPESAGNQRGFALILAVGMLALLSIIGALALSLTNSELGISGNYRSGEEAFLAADRAVQYATVNETIYSTIGTGSVSLTDNTSTPTLADDHATNIAAGTSDSGLVGTGNQVSYLTSGAVPPGMGSDPNYFQCRYYIVSATGGGPHNAVARVEAQVARVVPK